MHHPGAMLLEERGAGQTIKLGHTAYRVASDQDATGQIRIGNYGILRNVRAKNLSIAAA